MEPLPEDDLQDKLDRLAESGSLTRASVGKEEWTWRVEGLGLEPGTADRVLLRAVRAERES